MEARMSPTVHASYAWPDGFDRIPHQEWVHSSPDEFGISYDHVDRHGWYKNLQPTVAQVMARLTEGAVMLDYSGGTGILARRILRNLDHPAGIVIVDSSPKFLRVALENFRHDERVAFRLIGWLKEERRLQLCEEVIEEPLLRRGFDLLTSTNAIHLYYDLPGTLASWHRVLRPGGHVFACSGNLLNPDARPGEWIIDETVKALNDVAYELVRTEPMFERYRAVLDDEARMSQYIKLREKVFVPVRPLDYYTNCFEEAGFTVQDVFDTTVHARVDEWGQLLATYHEGVLGWVGGTRKIEGEAPTDQALRDRHFLIRYSLERLFAGRESFDCTWTYLTCRCR